MPAKRGSSIKKRGGVKACNKKLSIKFMREKLQRNRKKLLPNHTPEDIDKMSRSQLARYFKTNGSVRARRKSSTLSGAVKKHRKTTKKATKKARKSSSARASSTKKTSSNMGMILRIALRDQKKAKKG